MEGSFFPSQVTDDRIRVLQQRNGVEETPASGVDVLPKSAIEGYVRRTRSSANFDLRPGPGNLPALVRMGQDGNALQAAEAVVSRILLWTMAGCRESVIFARKILHFSSLEPVLI